MSIKNEIRIIWQNTTGLNQINKKLLNEDLEYIELLYESKHKFLGYNFTGAVSGVPITSLLWDNHFYLAIYFLIVTILSFFSMYILNRDVNILGNTIAYKIKQKHKPLLGIKRILSDKKRYIHINK